MSDSPNDRSGFPNNPLNELDLDSPLECPQYIPRTDMVAHPMYHPMYMYIVHGWLVG